MKRPKIPEQLLVFTGSFIFFLTTLAANFSGPHDSINYLNGIVSGHHLLHPHHLLYHFTAHYWLVLTQSIFPGIKDYYLVEAFTALCGSGSLTIVYSFFRKRFQLPALPSVISTSVIAFSYGMWFYSVNIEVYAPAMFLLLASLYVLTRPGFGLRDLWAAALLHAGAILFHQLHILFAVVIFYKLWTERKRLPLVRSLAHYALIGIVLVGGAYFLMGWVLDGHNSIDKWIGWMEGYTRHNDYWLAPGLKTPLYVFTGYSHAFVGGHFIFRIPGLSNYLDQSLAIHSLRDEIFLAQHISEPMAIGLTALSIAMAVVMLLLVIRFVRRFSAVRAQYGGVVLPVIVSGTVYSVFFCFWMPEILEFWIFQVVLFWVVLLGTLPVTGFPFRIKPLTGTILLSVSMLVINYFGSIRWLQDLEHDWYYTKVQPVKEVATPKDVILLQQGWILQDFLEYFTPAHVLEVPANAPLRPAVDKTITDCLTNGGKLFIYPEANSTNAAPDTHYIDSLLTRYRDRKTAFHTADPVIVVIQ